MINGEALRHQATANKILADIKENSSDPVLVYFDPDVDGLFAGKFWVDFCKKYSIPYEMYANPNREHGFLLPPERVKGRTVLSGDFQVPVEQFRDLVENWGVRWVHTDHHAYAEGSLALENGVYINPQATAEPQRASQLFQSGAGVVLDVLSHFDSSFNTPDYIAQVGITLLTDVRPLESEEPRGILDILYSRKYQGYFRYLLDNTYNFSKDYGFGIPEMNRTFIDYKFAPLMNSLFRFNHGDVAIRFVCEALRPADRVLMATIPTKQRTLIRQSKHWGKVYDFGNARFINFDLANAPTPYANVIGNYLGLISSHNSEEKSTLSAISSNGRVLRSSFRGKFEGLDYRSAIEKETSLPCLGHSTAFGVKFQGTEINSETFQKYARAVNNLESTLPETSSTSLHVVDTLLDTIDLVALAKENDFHDNQNKTYLHYVGAWSISSQKPSVIRYSCAGYEVLSFSADLSPSNALISPRYDRNAVTLILTNKLES